MGIRGLTAFLVSDFSKGVSVKMSLKEVSDEWKTNNSTNVTPKLIIDGGNCIRMVYEYGNLDWLCQGQWREYMQNLQLFIDHVRSNGFEPVFYFDGSAQPVKQDILLDRHQRYLKRVQTIYSMLERNENPNWPINRQDTWFMPPGIARLTPLLLKFEFDVKVHESEKLECDTEIAMLAREMGSSDQCAGILSSDTDFLIYDTKGVPYLLLDEYKSSMTQLTIFKCDQRILASALNISVNHLPILVCLVGNNGIPFDIVKQLHNRLGIQRQLNYAHFIWELMIKIADLIRFYQPQMTLLSLERKTFGEVNGLLTTGVNVYREALERDKVGKEIHLDKTENIQQKSTIQCNAEMEKYNSAPATKRLPLALEHPTLTKLTPAVVAFRSVRQRMMGLRGQQSVIEYSMYLGGCMEDGQLVEAFPSDIKFEQLSSPSVTSELKWQVICWIWSFPESLVSSLKELPSNLQRLTILLYFMRNNIELQKWEIEVIVRQACLMDSIRGIPQYSDFGLPLPRGINLAALLLRGLQTMITSVWECKSPIDLKSVMPWKFFDGKLFQSIYLKLHKDESMQKMDKTGEDMIDIVFA